MFFSIVVLCFCCCFMLYVVLSFIFYLLFFMFYVLRFMLLLLFFYVLCFMFYVLFFMFYVLCFMLFLLLYFQPPVRALYPNHEMVVLQPQTGTAMELESISNLTFYTSRLTPPVSTTFLDLFLPPPLYYHPPQQ